MLQSCEIEITNREKASSRHVPSLDGLRGIAVLAVILHHAADYLPQKTLLQQLAFLALNPGWFGVDLFFALSGFLITGILIDTRESTNYFRAFYARRALRIFPLYYLVLTSVLVLGRLYGSVRAVLPIRHDQPFYFIYLNNWWLLLRDTWHANILGHFWSLAVEEQFYLLWSVSVFLVPNKYVKKVCLAGILVALGIRCFIYLHAGFTRDVVENTFCRMDCLLAGALVATLVRDRELLIHVRKPIRWVGLISGVVALVLIVAGARLGWQAHLIITYTLLAIAFSTCILFAYEQTDRNTRFQTFLTNSHLMKVGRYSYGMYVYHVPLLWACMEIAARTGGGRWAKLASLAAAMLLTYLVAMLSFELFERRFLKLKRHFRAA